MIFPYSLFLPFPAPALRSGLICPNTWKVGEGFSPTHCQSLPRRKIILQTRDSHSAGFLSGSLPKRQSMVLEQFFLSYDTKISRLLKVSCLCPEIYSVYLKISRLVQTSGVHPKISRMGPETLIIQKHYSCFLSYDITNF